MDNQADLSEAEVEQLDIFILFFDYIEDIDDAEAEEEICECACFS